MLFSFKKIIEIANLKDNLTVEEVSHAITSIGFEVESIKKFTDVKGIKFGKILSVEKNPNSDKLNVCHLEFSDKKRVIQTTANNVSAGMVVIAFVPGSSANGITYEKKELKGIVSEGMLTSISEFGISKDLVRPSQNDGITSYNEVSDLKLDPCQYLGLDDYIIDIKVLSNRADVNSYFSLALELGAYFGANVKLPTRRQSQNFSTLKVDKENVKSLTLIEGKKDFTIPVKDQILLAKSNIKSINDIADLTNLTLIMTGQPTHAYDKKAVGKHFSAQYKSAKVKVFGNKEVQLKDNLVITSDHEIVSVAGVIGIEGKGVSDETTDFILEFGRFNIKDVRHSVKTVRLSTMASNQSSKEFNEALTNWAIDFVSQWTSSLTEPINEPSSQEKNVAFSAENLSFLAGIPNIDSTPKYKNAKDSMERIGFVFGDKIVKTPAHIHGINSQQDLAEEFFRFYGYDDLKPVAPTLETSRVNSKRDYHMQVATLGYQEVVTYTLLSKERNNFNPFNFPKTIALETFVSKEREEIRNSFAISLLEIIDYHQKRKINNISIFDIGMINDGWKTLGIASTIKTFEQIVFDLKNVISEKIVLRRFKDKSVHHGVSAQIFLDEQLIGWVGKLHPSLDSTNAFVAEVILPNIEKKVSFEEYKSTPLSYEDITIELGTNDDIAHSIEKYYKNDVYSIDVIDEYKKNNKNNITIRITYK